MLTTACHQLIHINQPCASAGRRDGSAPCVEQKQKGGSKRAF